MKLKIECPSSGIYEHTILSLEFSPTYFSVIIFLVFFFYRMEEDSLQIKATLVSDIKEVLDDCNPYVQNFRILRQHFTSSNVSDIKMRIIGKRGRDGRRYNSPTTSEVAALIVGDFDTAGCDRDIIVQTQCGELQRVPLLSPCYLPMQYPLLFPRGEDGFVEDVSFGSSCNAQTINRMKITLREWFAYRIQHRLNDKGLLLFGRRLFQQFLVDGYSMIESTRLQWIRFHQKDLRANMYSGLTDAVLRGESNASSTGRRIILPSTFVGGARYMFQNYKDAMSICSWAGYPDLFITFTCNHKWPELKEYFQSYMALNLRIDPIWFADYLRSNLIILSKISKKGRYQRYQKRADIW